jgi:hypothetical protein
LKRAATIAASGSLTIFNPTFFIDNLVGFGNDFVGDFLDNGWGEGFV